MTYGGDMAALVVKNLKSLAHYERAGSCLAPEGAPVTGSLLEI